MLITIFQDDGAVLCLSASSDRLGNLAFQKKGGEIVQKRACTLEDFERFLPLQNLKRKRVISIFKKEEKTYMAINLSSTHRKLLKQNTKQTINRQ